MLLTILAPVLGSLAGGYFTGVYLMRHRMQILNLAATLAWTLLVVLAALCWAVDRLFRESEFTGTARAPRSEILE